MAPARGTEPSHTPKARLAEYAGVCALLLRTWQALGSSAAVTQILMSGGRGGHCTLSHPVSSDTDVTHTLESLNGLS
jgi:hypothetical protein